MVGQDTRWIQAGDLESTRLTGYPAQPAATASVGLPSQSEEWKKSEGHWNIHVYQQLHQNITPAIPWYEHGHPSSAS